jgi:hypothetical protein
MCWSRCSLRNAERESPKSGPPMGLMQHVCCRAIIGWRWQMLSELRPANRSCLIQLNLCKFSVWGRFYKREHPRQQESGLVRARSFPWDVMRIFWNDLVLITFALVGNHEVEHVIKKCLQESITQIGKRVDKLINVHKIVMSSCSWIPIKVW